ncbi:MAG: hypothetical protein BGO76_03060 [Caedibacter sp. 38-128]|nr:LysR family transcriptional regulator [Holosporales bacterium]OJX08253.1 MAG: hypothetical protein BGO76_03060 [Caedibacter sp. 38-128]
MLDLKQLSAFYYVAKTRSFTLAETIVGVKQSWLSRQISELEDQFGSLLLERGHGTVSLTPEGQLVYEVVGKLLFEAKIIESLMSEKHNEPKGKLNIATTVGHAAWLIHYVPGFLKKYPEMRISISGNDENLDMRSQNADVAIRPFVPKSPELVHIYLLSYPLGLFASPLYLKEFGVPKKPEDLDNHRLIAFAKDKRIPFGNVDWHLKLGTKNDETREPYLQVNSALGLARAAELGLGIVSISKFQEVSKGVKLIEVLSDIEGPMVDVHYVYPKRLEHVKRLTVFGDYMVEILEKESKKPDSHIFRKN